MRNGPSIWFGHLYWKYFVGSIYGKETKGETMFTTCYIALCQGIILKDLLQYIYYIAHVIEMGIMFFSVYNE